MPGAARQPGKNIVIKEIRERRAGGGRQKAIATHPDVQARTVVLGAAVMRT